MQQLGSNKPRRMSGRREAVIRRQFRNYILPAV
jgi:hypothetical protein